MSFLKAILEETYTPNETMNLDDPVYQKAMSNVTKASTTLLENIGLSHAKELNDLICAYNQSNFIASTLAFQEGIRVSLRLLCNGIDNPPASLTKKRTKIGY